MGKAGTAGGSLVLDAGKRPRKRRAARDSWSAAKERAFLTALADSCNVKLAATVAKVSTSAIYVRRQRNATFRRAWDLALATGYAQLEMVMLERALHGVEKIVVVKGEPTVMREYSDRVGLALLRIHRDSVAMVEEEASGGDSGEAAERIMARLVRLRGGEDAVVEVKSGGETVAIVRWALRHAREGDAAGPEAGN